jgi:hypothetical protein
MELVVDLHLDAAVPWLDLARVERLLRHPQLKVLLGLIVEVDDENVLLAGVRFDRGRVKLEHRPLTTLQR